MMAKRDESGERSDKERRERETSHPNFDHLRLNPLIYLEDLARSHDDAVADSDSGKRLGESQEKAAAVEEEAAEEEKTPALLSRPADYNPFTPKT